MDKKNTMLLTVIAVATLLVAVVGATFAYFNVTATNDTADSPTVIQGTSEEVGSVVLNMGKQLHLDVTAEDMSQTGQGTTKLYSTTEESGNKKSPSQDALVTAKVTGGATGTTYSCNFTLKVDTTGTTMTFTDADEATLNLTGANGAQVTTTKIDLKDVEESTTTPVTFTIDGSKLTDTNVVTGYVELQNTIKDQSTTIGGNSLKVSLSAEGFTCQTQAGD